MKTTKLNCYIHFQNGLLSTYKELGNNINSMVNELIQNCSHIILPMAEFGNFMPDMKLIDVTELPSDHELIGAINGNRLPGIRYKDRWLTKNLLSISIEVPIPDFVDENVVKDITEIDKDFFNNISVEQINLILIFEAFKKRVFDLIIAANLSRFGSMHIFRSIIIQDNREIEKFEEITCTTLYHVSKFIEEIGYPTLHKLDFLTVWNWIINRSDYLNGFSNGATGRALACFSMLFSPEHPNELFMAIMGIEALYTKGTGNLQEQVREKSQEFLGKQESFKKIYANMYNFRSRYIHGDLNFPTPFSLDKSNKTTRYNEELEQATFYAIALLGATLQELIIHNWSGLEFNYIVSDLDK